MDPTDFSCTVTKSRKRSIFKTNSSCSRVVSDNCKPHIVYLQHLQTSFNIFWFPLCSNSSLCPLVCGPLHTSHKILPQPPHNSLPPPKTANFPYPNSNSPLGLSLKTLPLHQPHQNLPNSHSHHCRAPHDLTANHFSLLVRVRKFRAKPSS